MQFVDRNLDRFETTLEVQEELAFLLERYIQLLPVFIPPRFICGYGRLVGYGKVVYNAHSPTLWHPDLHLENIFVDPSSKKITDIVN